MEEDILLKRYFADNARYADLINGISFGGRQVVTATDLAALDTLQEKFKLTHDDAEKYMNLYW